MIRETHITLMLHGKIKIWSLQSKLCNPKLVVDLTTFFNHVQFQMAQTNSNNLPSAKNIYFVE